MNAFAHFVSLYNRYAPLSIGKTGLRRFFCSFFCEKLQKRLDKTEKEAYNDGVEGNGVFELIRFKDAFCFLRYNFINEGKGVFHVLRERRLYL